MTEPSDKVIVNSRIGAVNNSKGLYAVVGPMGTRCRHLLMALCGLCDPGNKVSGTFYMNGTLLSLDELLRKTSYVSGADDMCPELTVREVCEEYLDLEEQYPSLQKEIRKHLFKLLHRGLCVDVESRSQLANLRLITKEDKDRVRELIAHVERAVMEREGGEWLVQNSTLRSDYWYRRHRCSSV